MAKAEDLETKCKKAIIKAKDTVLNIRDILKDIEMELTHLIEYKRYKFFSMPKYKGKYKVEYDFYNGNGYGK
jgi:hypothetical protein